MRGSQPRRPLNRRHVRERIRFALERLVLRGLRYRLLLAASIVLAVALVAGMMAALTDAGSKDLSEHVWWAFLRLTDPGYLGDDEGIARRSISTVVTVLGYLVFLGLLIAILTQWLDELISKLESGVTPVPLSGHVIVLGFSHRTPTIVAELLGTGARLQRFLASHGARELQVVIMAERVDGTLLRGVRERLGPLWSEKQVLLRSGSPLHLDHLERVAFREAAVVILGGADFGERKPEAVDAETVKTLMAVSKHARASRAVPPLAVAELYDGRRAFVAREAYAGDSEILATDDIVSRLLAESVRQRGLCSVFTELLTLGVGCALYVRHFEGLAGTRFGEIRTAFSRAVVLGTVRSGEGWPALNPDPETILEEEDLLVFVARSFEDCIPGERSGGSAQTSPPVTAPPAPESRRVLILGWSRKVPALLEDFGGYGEGAFEIDVVSSTPIQERESTMARHGPEAPNGRVQQIEAGFTAPGVLERLEPQHYDSIVLLASERLEEAEQADATTVFAYRMVRRFFPEEGPRPHVLVELMDEENLFLFEDEDVDVIVSPLLVSYLLSQVALRRELAAVFAELTRPKGTRIALESARQYLATSQPVRFEDLERVAAARGEIALGFRRAGDSDDGPGLNPDRDVQYALESGDEVVVLRSHTEPEGEGANRL